jgi:hypothetical protein
VSPTTEVATTTTTSTTTTTTLPENIDLGAASTECIRDAPYVVITFGNQPSLDGLTGSILFYAVTGELIGVHSFTYHPNETLTYIYPGAEVDDEGNAIDWPGWLLNSAGFWVPDLSDAFFRDGLTVVAEINPTATANVTYPPQTSACANPSGPFPPPATPRLPATR